MVSVKGQHGGGFGRGQPPPARGSGPTPRTFSLIKYSVVNPETLWSQNKMFKIRTLTRSKMKILFLKQNALQIGRSEGGSTYRVA